MSESCSRRRFLQWAGTAALAAAAVSLTGCSIGGFPGFGDEENSGFDAPTYAMGLLKVCCTSASLRSEGGMNTVSFLLKITNTGSSPVSIARSDFSSSAIGGLPKLMEGTASPDAVSIPASGSNTVRVEYNTQQGPGSSLLDLTFLYGGYRLTYQLQKGDLISQPYYAESLQGPIAVG